MGEEQPISGREHWRRNVRLTTILLLCWFGTTFLATFFAQELNQFTFLGFPLGFYMAAQGSLLINALIIFVYTRYMTSLDRKAGVPTDEQA